MSGTVKCDSGRQWRTVLAFTVATALLVAHAGLQAPLPHAAPAKKAEAQAKPPTAEGRSSAVVPLPVRKPEDGFAHPGVHGPRPVRIAPLFPPVRFKVRRQNGRIIRTEIDRRPAAELIAAAKSRTKRPRKSVPQTTSGTRPQTAEK